MEERKLHKFIKEICSELNINVKELSYNWILELSKNNKIFHIVANNFDLNSESSGIIACDKYATYEVLKNNGVPVIEHTMLFNPKRRSQYTSIDNNDKIMIEEYKRNKVCVLKPNNGCEGKRNFSM